MITFLDTMGSAEGLQDRERCSTSCSLWRRLEQALISYQNRSIETAQIIAQLIDLAKEMQAARRRGEDLGLSEEELAFYDAARDQ